MAAVGLRTFEHNRVNVQDVTLEGHEDGDAAVSTRLVHAPWWTGGGARRGRKERSTREHAGRA